MGLLFTSLMLSDPLRMLINFSGPYGSSERRIELDTGPVSKTATKQLVERIDNNRFAYN